MVEKAEQKKMFCEHCRRQIDANLTKCPHCGAELTNRVKPEQVGKLKPPFQ